MKPEECSFLCKSWDEGKGVQESKGSVLKRLHIGGWPQQVIGSAIGMKSLPPTS